MSCPSPSTAIPARPPQTARSVGRLRIRHSEAIRNEKVTRAGSPSVAAILIAVQCASKGAPRYEPGLVPNPVTNKVEKNLDEARLAIDAFAAIFDVLRLRIEEQTRREMETVLTNLRINFVEKSSG